MNKKLKKFMSLILVSVMISSFTSTVFASQENSPKEETVYVMLDQKGTAGNVYVVNSYENYSGGELLDYGKYDSVRNLSTLDVLKNENSQVTATVPKGKFYYEGKIASAEIPWNIAITYTLDGAPITTQNLVGKQGKVEIEIKLSQNKNFGSEFYENYALQIATSMDTNKCSNILAPGANISSVGESKNISFTSLPKKDGSYKISADVTNFEMGAITIAGLPFTMDLKLDGLGDMTSGLTDLTDVITKIDNGATALKNGSTTLKEGMNELSDKSSTLTSGSSSILNAITQINGSLSKMDQLTSSAGAVAQLKSGSLKYQSSINELNTKFQTLPNASQAIYDGIKSSASGLSSIATDDKSMETLLNNLSSANDPNINALIKAYKTKMQVVSSVSTGLSSLEAQYGTFNKGISDISTASTALTNQYDKISSGIENVNLALSNLNDLSVAMDTLEAQYKQLNNGVNEYTNAYKKLVAGYDTVYSGISTLSTGTSELQAKTKNIDKDISSKLTNTLDGFSNSDFKPISYSSTKNTNISSVQFVMKTDAIKADTKVVINDKEPDKLSFWEKFLALF